MRVGVVVCAALAAPACAVSTSSLEVAAPATRLGDQMEIRMTASPSRPRVGDTVRVEIFAVNHGPEPFQITEFPCSGPSRITSNLPLPPEPPPLAAESAAARLLEGVVCLTATRGRTVPPGRAVLVETAQWGPVYQAGEFWIRFIPGWDRIGGTGFSLVMPVRVAPSRHTGRAPTEPAAAPP